MNKEIDERGERRRKVKWLKEKIRDIRKVIWQYARICFIAIIIVIGILVWLLKHPLEEPLPINYGMSWVILTLISMITLTYVQLINRLKDILISEQKEKRRIEASGMICMLVETLSLFFITILALVIRIALLSLYPDLAELVSVGNQTIENSIGNSIGNQTIENQTIENSIGNQTIENGLIGIDYIMVSSLIVGSCMRVYIFLKSYVCKTILSNYKSFMKKQYKILDKEDKEDTWVSRGGIVLQKAFLLSKVAKEQFDSLPNGAKNRVEREVLYYLKEPEKKQMLDIKKLKGVKLKGVKGKDLFRLRIEDYNAVYSEDANSFKIIQFREKELGQWYR